MLAQKQSIQIKEHEHPIPVHLQLPAAVLHTANHHDEAYAIIQSLIAPITALAQEAYGKQNEAAWAEIQSILYYWNYRDLMRVERLDSASPLVEYALRRAVLDIEAQHTPRYSLESKADFTPERAVQELADRVFSHRINEHPLLETMAEEGLPLPIVRLFLENYYVNNRLFHLFIAALNLSTPLARRTELANNLYDELGSGDAINAHPLLFFKNFNNIGAPQSVQPIPEALYLANEKTRIAFLSGDYHYGMGGFGYIELAMPNQMKKILSGLKKSGLPHADLEFWETHITIDEQHGKTWFEEMLKLLRTPEQAEKCLNGGLALLNARATMFDGVWRANA